MIMSKKLNIFLLLLFLSFLIIESGEARDTEETSRKDSTPSIIKLTKNISRITLQYGLRPNTAALTGPDGVLLVDTGHKDVADELKSIAEDLKSGEVNYIINTHLHGDHAGGNLLAGENAQIIHYKNLSEYVTKGVLKKGKEEWKGKLGKYLGKYYILNFNGEKIKIIPYPGVHSDADLIIYFSDSGVAHMGDLLLTQSFPAVGPNVKEYLKFLEKVFDFLPTSTKFIGGHGRDYTMKDLKEYQNMLLTTIEIVRKEMKSGKSVEEVKSAKVLERWESWGEFLEFLNTDYWIEAIYKSYK
jgi:cyclase